MGEERDDRAEALLLRITLALEKLVEMQANYKDPLLPLMDTAMSVLKEHAAAQKKLADAHARQVELNEQVVCQSTKRGPG